MKGEEYRAEVRRLSAVVRGEGPSMSESEATVAAPRMDMSMSATIGKIAAALAKAQSMMGPALKDREGVIPGKDGKQGYRYGYATLASCFEAVQPLHKNGIAVTQIPLDGGDHGVRVATFLVHESGEWIRGELWMPAPKTDAQGFGSALTYARRYGLSALAGLASDDDDGAEATAKQPQQVQQAPKPGPAKTKSKKEESPAAPALDTSDEAVEWQANTCEAVAKANSFKLLFDIASDADIKPEPGRGVVFDHVAIRCAELIAVAPDNAVLQESKGLVQALGSPSELLSVYNKRYAELRAKPTGEASA